MHPDDTELAGKVTQLTDTINKGQAIKGLLATPGWQQVLGPWLQGKINDSKNAWLTAPKEEAESIRQKAGVYLEVFQAINSWLKTSEFAEQEYQKLIAEGAIPSPVTTAKQD